MAIKRIHPYVETDDLDASRSFYTEVFGLQVAMETPVMSLQAPDLTSAQVIVCPRGFETPQPDFGIDVGDPEAVEQAHAHVHDRGLRVVYPLTTEPWGSDGSSSRTPTADHQRPRAPPKRHLSGIRSHMPGDHARSRSPACAARPCDDRQAHHRDTAKSSSTSRSAIRLTGRAVEAVPRPPTRRPHRER